MLQFSLRFHSRRRTTSQKGLKAFRNLIALGLTTLLFLAPLSFRASAQQPSETNSKSQRVNQFTIYQDANGNVVCREATLLEREQAAGVDTENLGLRQINHLEYQKGDRATKVAPGENAGTGLTIILRATSQLQANQTAVNAFNRAAQNWENLIQSPITIYIDVDYGTTNFGKAWGAGVLGSTSAPSSAYPYQSVRTNLNAEATGEGNATKQAIFNALPQTTVPTDLGDKSSTVVSDSAARAIGLLPATAQSTDTAAKIAFNSNFSFDFNPDDGISPGQTDFDAVATHEIGHALGFHSEAGASARPSVWDLYRFRTGTTSGTFTTAQRILTVGGSPDPLQFYFVPGNSELGLSTGGPDGSTTNGGDGWQSSHWKHFSGCSGAGYIGIMDPAISSGCRRTITSNDSLALTSFGYNLTNGTPPPPPPPAPTPPANDNFASAQTIAGCSGSVTGTTIGATKETGEPSHDPSDTSSNSPGHTVWYQWQAPSTGSTTITTEGSEFDTILAIYTGTSVSSLTRALKPDGTPAFNDDVQDGVITTSSVTFNATAGTVYRIAVDGWGGDSGSVKLNWTESNCSGATTPTITWNNPADITYGTALSAAQLNATASTSGTFTYNPTAGTILNAGSNQTLSVNFTPNDTTNFNSASKSVQINVLKANQTITFGALGGKTFGDAPFTVSATASSSLPVSFQILSGPATISGNTVTITGAGTVTVRASQSGDANFNAAPSVDQSFTVAKANQSITFSALSNKTYGDAPFTISATATSSLPVSFSILSGPASISGNTVTITGAGTVTVRASQAGDSNYSAALSVDQSFTINKAQATITLGNLTQTFDGTTKSVIATTNPAGLSSVTITYNGSTTAPTNAGSYPVVASLSNSNYQATDATGTLVIAKATATIALTNLSQTFDGTPKSVTATTNPSGLQVVITYSQNGTPVMSPTNIGSYNVSATINDANYQGSATGVLVINDKVTPTITWNNPADITFGTPLSATQLNATASVPGTFTYSPAAGMVLNAGNNQTLTVNFTPTDTANNNSVSKTVSINVLKADQTVTFGALPSKTFGDAPFTVSATSSSGLPVTFSIASGPATINGQLVTITGAGTVVVRASQSGGANFNAAPVVDQSFTVAKATPVITWANPANIIAGTPLSITQLNATANVPGTFLYTPAAGIELAVGTTQLSVTFTPTDTTNYTTAQKSVQLTVVPVPITVSFSSASYSVSESNGSVQIIVNRSGDTSAASSVNYATSDTAGLTACSQANTGIASSRCDYATTVGTLQFAAGETTKTIFIPIVNDSYKEGNENFQISLSSPSGATLGTTSTAVITIVDDDATTGGNPVVDSTFFIRQQYIDFLGREPDPAGLAGWQSVLNNCAPSGQDANGNFCDRIEVSSGFFRSPEFQDRGYFVFRYYPVALGRNPSYVEFMPDLAKVSGFLSDAQLEANKVAFVQEFMARPEFQTKYGSLSDSAFHDAIVQMAGIDPGISFPQTGMTRAQFLRAFVESVAVYQKFYNQSFVVMQYFGYLRRDPDILYLQWIDTMNKNGGDYRVMINGFMNSTEYFLRFGP